MPSIISGVAACIIARSADYAKYGTSLALVYTARTGTTGQDRSADYQACMQLAFIFITLGVSISSGLLVGFLASFSIFDGMKEDHLFRDEECWEVPHLETPYYFDGRGEVSLKELKHEMEKAQREHEVSSIGKTGPVNDPVNDYTSKTTKPQKLTGGDGDDLMKGIVDRLDIIMSELATTRLSKAKYS